MIARSLRQLRQAEGQLGDAAREALRRREIAASGYHAALRAFIERGEESRLATAEALCRAEARSVAGIVVTLRELRQEIRQREEARHGEAADA